MRTSDDTPVSRDISVQGAVQTFAVIGAALVIIWLLVRMIGYAELVTTSVILVTLITLGYLYDRHFGSLFALGIIACTMAENSYDPAKALLRNVAFIVAFLIAPFVGYGLSRLCAGCTSGRTRNS